MLYKTLVKKVSISPEKKTKQKDYLSKGQLPIIDQGQQLIGGYSDNLDMQLSCKLPVIVFGDHTRSVKYVDFPFGAGADGIKVLEPTQGVHPKYLYYATQYLVLQLEDRGYARHYQYIEKKELNIPSIPEQKHIVSRIEELFSEMDNGVETLQKTKQQLAVYRQAVYHDVMNSFESKKYILSDLVTTIEGDRGKNYPKREEFLSEGYCLFLTAQNVRPSGWRFENSVFISAEKDKVLRSGKLQRNDIVITTRGTLGNIAVYDESVPYENIRVNSCMLILRIDSALVSPYYLASFLTSPIFKAQIENLKSGTAQPQIPASVLRNTIINIPSLSDQERINAELSQRFSVCDSIEKTVDTALQQAAAMRQSILKQAFEGNL